MTWWRRSGVVTSPFNPPIINEKGGLGGSTTVEIDSTGDIHKDTDEEQQNKS